MPLPSFDPALFRLLDGLDDAALLVDAGACVVRANEAAQRAFPVVTGRHVLQTIRDPAFVKAVECAMRDGKAVSETLHLGIMRDRTFAVRVIPLGESENRSDQAAFILCRDLTEQEQVMRMRADFVANASHELRTPLAALRGFIETLQTSAVDDPLARGQFLGIMQEQAFRMSRLIDDLLSLSRIEMREHVPPEGTIALGEIVEEVTQALRPMADAAHITLMVKRTDSRTNITGDHDEITQVVQNLVQNAIKYGRRDGRVEISVTNATGLLTLSVQDDGVGIEPHHVPRLTERFYRVSTKESRERGGTGLGLAIVKHIVARHGGALTIQSVPGEGSTFAVSFPVKK